MKILRDHINDLVTCRNKGFTLVINELFDLVAFDLRICILTNNIATGLQAFDVMSGNTNVHFADLEVGITFIAIL